jgi:hypothetical protein
MTGKSTSNNDRLEGRLSGIIRERCRQLAYQLEILKASSEARRDLHEHTVARLKEQLSIARDRAANFDFLHRYHEQPDDWTTRCVYEQRVFELERELAREHKDVWKDTLDVERLMQVYRARLAKLDALLSSDWPGDRL